MARFVLQTGRFRGEELIRVPLSELSTKELEDHVLILELLVIERGSGDLKSKLEGARGELEGRYRK